MRRKKAPEAVVHTVTTASSRSHDDQDERVRRYVLMMGTRIACFALVPFVQGWLRWACVIAATVLPYFAVILANAVRPAQRGFVEPVTPQEPVTAQEPTPQQLTWTIVDPGGNARPREDERG